VAPFSPLKETFFSYPVFLVFVVNPPLPPPPTVTPHPYPPLYRSPTPSSRRALSSSARKMYSPSVIYFNFVSPHPVSSLTRTPTLLLPPPHPSLGPVHARPGALFLPAKGSARHAGLPPPPTLQGLLRPRKGTVYIIIIIIIIITPTRMNGFIMNHELVLLLLLKNVIVFRHAGLPPTHPLKGLLRPRNGALYYSYSYSYSYSYYNEFGSLWTMNYDYYYCYKRESSL